MSDGRYDALCRAAGDVSRETFERLLLFERRFVEWNARINLSSKSDAGQLWNRHIVDCAQLITIGPDFRYWLDIGSGGGFPGVIVAILLKGKGDARVDLVESNRKKAAFLSRIVGETGAPATVHACRVEQLYDQVGKLDVVTARAVAELKTLLNYSRHWLEHGAKGLFQKGRDYRSEIEDCGDEWQFDLVEHASCTDPESVVLEISSLRHIG